ncbi:c-type cytochrome [Algoriphagus kandeliae]|uniref:C-type cytochrome n=1 Tax=Algoriphagus kandeliae TaxID=2562278 RepID=A0A4Y9R175_9BACT|nr:cytochrome c [Algoriphagus kandeliae]TFV97672.1 c-type cytochrome [Algoriphagus kandeliae]
MKKLITPLIVLLAFTIASCGGGESTDTADDGSVKKKPASMLESTVPASERITLDNKGVGRIKDLPLDATIDVEMVARGEKIFNTNCSACHKIDKRFIGPSPKGIMKRRSPEWIMNMILDPQLMVEQDRCAKDLLIEFNGAAMANQNMTVEQARDILEYFRTLD